jgi:hypothetical protein
MNRSVVTHHWTAWWRSHHATSRWIAGSVRRRRSGRGGKRVAGATSASRSVPLAQLQPDQEAIGQHHCHRVPMEPGPQPPLVLIPAQFAFGLFMELLHRMAPMSIASQLVHRGRGRQITPVVLPLLGLAPRGALAQQPADLPLALAWCAVDADISDRRGRRVRCIPLGAQSRRVN